MGGEERRTARRRRATGGTASGAPCVSGSIPRVGSSSSSTGAPAAAMAAAATSSRWPAERSRGWRARQPLDAEPFQDQPVGSSGSRARSAWSAPRRRPCRRTGSTRAPAGRAPTSTPGLGDRPPTVTVPSAGVCTPAMHRSSVVFPAPLRPITATISPRPTERSTPRSAAPPPCRACRSRTSASRVAARFRHRWGCARGASGRAIGRRGR